ncbi:hypothetical protein FJT64_024368 [Amphibalanus amphitrite]|uniref:Uncharacterized protein n=1 Tax=Amphibalanus amphitrite TaxID=1232801 RepID=A0A6A4WP38_AMPAM|nr:hypothetical protein FJT64_024368 [Amphibalanus amphitrite]
MGVTMTTGRRGLCSSDDTVHVRPASRVLVQPNTPLETAGERAPRPDDARPHRKPLASLASLAAGMKSRQLSRRPSAPRALGPQEKDMFIRARRFVVRSRLTDIQEGAAAMAASVPRPLKKCKSATFKIDETTYTIGRMI